MPPTPPVRLPAATRAACAKARNLSRHVGRKNLFGAFSLLDLLGRRDAPTPQGSLALPRFLTTCRLPLLLGPQREGLVELRRHCAAELLLQPRELLFEFRDPLIRSLQLTRLHRDRIDQLINANPPLANIVLELLNLHAPCITHPPKSRSTISENGQLRRDAGCPELGSDDHHASAFVVFRLWIQADKPTRHSNDPRRSAARKQIFLGSATGQALESHHVGHDGGNNRGSR